MPHEEHEQLELEVGQLDLFAGARDHAAAEIDRDVVEAELAARDDDRRRRRHDRAGRLDAPQDGIDPREQLGERERLGDVVIRAEPQRGDLVELAVARGQHDHRHQVVGGAQRGEHLEPVALG